MSSYAQYLGKLTNDISFSLGLILSVVGIPCNCLALFIFARLTKNRTNMGFLYIWLCSIDILIQLIILFILQSKRIFEVTLTTQSTSMCMLVNFLQRFVPRTSSWITVLITFERLIFVLYGHSNRFKLMKSKLFLTGIIFAIIVFVAIATAPSLFFYIVSGSCTADVAVLLLSDLSTIIVRALAPFLLMLLFNIIMIRKIIKQRKRVLIAPSRSTRNRKENDFTVSAMANSVFFLIFNFPLVIYIIFYYINSYSGAFNSSNDVFTASYSLTSVIASYFSFFMQSFSFAIYFFFNKLFRLELYSLFSRLFCFKCSNRVGSVTQIKPL